MMYESGLEGVVHAWRQACADMICDGGGQPHHVLIGPRRSLGDPGTGDPTHGQPSHWHHVWRVDTVRRLVADETEPITFFCGGSRNVSEFLELFDGVFVLEVDSDTLFRRLDQRPEDEFGAKPAERELIVRLHPIIRGKVKLPHGVHNGGAGFQMQDLLAAADVLITDYSSVMFDYAVLQRPMIFYVPDLEQYRDHLRGFYFDFEQEAPGPLVRTTAEVIDLHCTSTTTPWLPSATGSAPSTTAMRPTAWSTSSPDGACCDRWTGARVHPG